MRHMIDLKMAKTRIKELEEELKVTREDYEEEIEVLVDKNADLVGERCRKQKFS